MTSRFGSGLFVIPNLFRNRSLRFPFFTLKTILLLIHVDKKNTLKNVVLGFLIKLHSSSSLNLLVRNKEDPSEGLFKEKTEGYEPG